MRPERVPAGIKRGRMTPEENNLVIDLSEKGFSAGRIAPILNRHPSTVHFALVRHGLVKPKAKSFSYMRKGHRVVSFDRDEDAFLQATRAAGHTFAVIRKAIMARFGRERSTGTIGVRLLMLANRDDAP